MFTRSRRRSYGPISERSDFESRVPRGVFIFADQTFSAVAYYALSTPRHVRREVLTRSTRRLNNPLDPRVVRVSWRFARPAIFYVERVSETDRHGQTRRPLVEFRRCRIKLLLYKTVRGTGEHRILSSFSPDNRQVSS